MNRGVVFLFVALGFTTIVRSQQTLDSLVSQLTKFPATGQLIDTNRLRVLGALGDYYQNINPDSAVFFHTRAISLADELLNQHAELNAMVRIHIELRKGENIKKAGWDYLLIGELDKAVVSFSKALAIAEKYRSSSNGLLRRKADQLYAGVIFNTGTLYYVKSEYALALDYYLEALEINRAIGNAVGESANLGNIGAVYHSLGNYSKALDYYYQALRMDENLGNLSGQSYNLGNIGITYRNLGEHEKALEHYSRAQEIDKALGDIAAQSANLVNIGTIYNYLGDYDKSLNFYAQALSLDSALGDRRGMAIDYGNIGAVYFHIGDADEALKNYMLALKLSVEQDDKETQANNLANLGEAYTYLGRFAEAENYLHQALSVSYEIKAADLIRLSHFHLSILYEKMNKFPQALDEYKKYVSWRDSVFNEVNTKAAIQKEMQFEHEKETAADSVAHAREQEVSAAEIARNEAEITVKENQQYALFGGLLLVVVFALFMYNRFRVTRAQKQIIEHQKKEVELQKDYAEQQRHLVEEKNKEITDSINYAKRIQAAILPPQRLVKEHLPESFILYKPKDIVAGDFYWLERVQLTSGGKQFVDHSNTEQSSTSSRQLHTAGCILFAAADCTGHGVPGAMVSVICNNGLNRSVREHGLTDPGKILDKTREIVIQEFEKSEEEVKDGMDISLCSLVRHSDGGTLSWSGANNPLWIIRKNGKVVEEIKADKQPIGKYTGAKPFTTHHINLEKGDSIYIFTDGFQDQFGGEKGKKFKASSMKELLLTVQDRSMEDQKVLLSEVFENWRGKLEQLDDVCVIGVKI